ESGPMSTSGSVGWHTLARDHAGGLVYLAEGSLWWIPAGEDQAHEVSEVEGDLVEVVPAPEGPVARIGLCESTYIDLADGSVVEERFRTAVDVDCPDGATTWRAANGLEATVVGPGVLFDSEGQVAGIE